METAGSSGCEGSKFQEQERSPRTERADRKVVLDDSQGIAIPGMDPERGMGEGKPRPSIGGTADGQGIKMRCRGNDRWDVRRSSREVSGGMDAV
jgi:hypothetical protein